MNPNVRAMSTMIPNNPLSLISVSSSAAFAVRNNDPMKNVKKPIAKLIRIIMLVKLLFIFNDYNVLGNL